MKGLLTLLVGLCLVAMIAVGAHASTLALWDFNGQVVTPSIGSGTLTLVNTISNFETDPTKIDPNDTGSSLASLEIGQTWPAQTAASLQDGIRFNVSTVGHSNIKVKYDIRHSIKSGESAPNTDAFQYSTDGGATWINGPCWTAAGDQWYFNRTIDLSSDAAVNNNPNFAFRIVGAWQPGAGKYMPCPGSVYGTTRKWRLDLISVYDDPPTPPLNTVALWDFNDQRDLIADYGDGISACQLLGGIALDGDGYSKDYPSSSEPWDTSGSSDPSLKGKGLDTALYPAQGNGSDSAGVQFNVSTVGYSGIKLSFDLKQKKEASRYIRVQYTTNRTASPVTWVSADPLFCNVIADPTQDAWWFNGNAVDLSSIPAVDNNPNFAFRIVTEFDPNFGGQYTAAMDGLAYGADPYYNKLRYDMVRVTATSAAPASQLKSILDTKKASEWQRVTLQGVRVSRSHPDLLWLETDNRAGGLKVYCPQNNVNDGWLVDVTGITRQGRDSEKYIYASSVTQHGTDLTLVKPMITVQKGLGGADWLYDPVSHAGQMGTPAGKGLNNIGLLVAVSGLVTAEIPEADTPGNLDMLYVDDGSGLYDGNLYGPNGTPALGVRICLPKNATGSYLGKYVRITGVSSVDLLDSVTGTVVRAIRLPQIDIVLAP